MKQKVHKITIEFVLCGPATPGRGACADVWLIGDSTGGKLLSLCHWVSVADSVLSRTWTLCTLPLSWPHLVWAYAGLVSSYALILVCLGDIVSFWSHLLPWALGLFLPPLSPWREGLMKTSPLRTECLSLYAVCHFIAFSFTRTIVLRFALDPWSM